VLVNCIQAFVQEKDLALRFFCAFVTFERTRKRARDEGVILEEESMAKPVDFYLESGERGENFQRTRASMSRSIELFDRRR
jgi:hypothetical protein